MLRHVKEKHQNTSARAMDADQRPKNYFVYYTPEQLQYHSGAVGKSNEPGRFVHYPYGVQPQTAIACTVATPTLAPSRPNSPARSHQPASSNNLPQTAIYASNGGVYQTPANAAYVQSYATPTSSQQTYLGHAYSAQHNVAHTVQQSYQPVANGSATTIDNSSYSQQVAPNSVHQLHQQPQHSAIDSGRAVVQSPNQVASTSGPVFVAPPGNSVQVKRVLHSDAYVKNYYVYYTPEQLQYHVGTSGTVGKNSEPGRFVHYPYGVQPQATIVATSTLTSSRPNSPARAHQPVPSSNLPQTATYASNAVSGVYQVPANAAYVQSYATPTSSQQTYLGHAYTTQHSVASAVQQPYQPVANGADNSSYSQQVAPNSVHQLHQQPQHSAIDSGRAVVQSPNQVASTSGPVFVAPPGNSVQVKRVLHSDAYVKYIESLYSAKQRRSVSKWDNCLMVNHRNTSTNHRKLPYEWVKKISPAVLAVVTNGQNGESTVNRLANGTSAPPMTAKAAKAAAREAKAREKEANNSAGNGFSNSVASKEEQEVIRSLWRLRNQLLENTIGIQRTAAAAIDY